MFPVVLVDSMNFFHRARSQVEDSKSLADLTVRTPEGMFHSGVFLVCSTMLLSMKGRMPEAEFLFVFDRGDSGRKKISSAYKANRDSSYDKDDLSENLCLFIDLLLNLGQAVVWSDGYEADDVIASLALTFEDREVFIHSNDKDFYQLVKHPHIRCWRPKIGRGEEVFVDPDYCKSKMGVGPDHVLLLRSFNGDPSDNIDGIPSTGRRKEDLKPSFLKKICAQYDTLDDLYEAVESDSVEGIEVSETQKGALLDFKEKAYRNWSLMEFQNPGEVYVKQEDPDLSAVREQFARLRFFGLFSGDVEAFENKMKKWEDLFGKENSG